MARYHFYFTPNNETICISTYAKKTVKGVAKCSQNDKFDATIGKRLAMLRCDKKIAKKRMNRAIEKLNYYTTALSWARREYDKALAYAQDATHAYDEACKWLEDEENFLR